MKSFKDWLAKKESSAFTRSRRQYALGLGPDMPDASLNSRSTCPPGYLELIKGRKKKKKKKKKKRKRSKVHEAKEDIKPDYSIDKWLQAVDRLKKDLDDEKLKKKPEDDDLKLGDEDFEDEDEFEDDEELEDDEEELEDDEEEFDMEPPSFSPLALGRRMKPDAEIPDDFGGVSI